MDYDWIRTLPINATHNADTTTIQVIRQNYDVVGPVAFCIFLEDTIDKVTYVEAGLSLKVFGDVGDYYHPILLIVGYINICKIKIKYLHLSLSLIKQGDNYVLLH